MVKAQDISNDLLKHNVLIDLAADFRLNKASDYLKWYKQKHRSVKNIKKSIYSLPEINGKPKLKILILLDVQDVTQHQYYYHLFL